MTGAVMLNAKKSWLVLACAEARTETARKKAETNAGFGMMAPFNCGAHYRARGVGLPLRKRNTQAQLEGLRDL